MTPIPSPGPAAALAPTPRRTGLRLLRPLLTLLGAIRRRPGHSLAIALLVALILGGLTLGGVQLWAGYHLRAARTAMARYHYMEAGPHLQACLMVRPNDRE